MTKQTAPPRNSLKSKDKYALAKWLEGLSELEQRLDINALIDAAHRDLQLTVTRSNIQGAMTMADIDKSKFTGQIDIETYQQINTMVFQNAALCKRVKVLEDFVAEVQVKLGSDSPIQFPEVDNDGHLVLDGAISQPFQIWTKPKIEVQLAESKVHPSHIKSWGYDHTALDKEAKPEESTDATAKTDETATSDELEVQDV